MLSSMNFNPRSPCGERRGTTSMDRDSKYFNPRSPCGERPFSLSLPSYSLMISIHAPRAGSDAGSDLDKRMTEIFQSTLPVRGATLVIQLVYTTLRISIHAPRAGSDTTEIDIAVRAMLFQSTPPVRGATMFNISTIRCSWNFNPRPPCGGRRCISAYCNWEAEISIHAPRAGGDSFPATPRLPY